MSKRGTSPPGDGQLVKRARSNTPPRSQLVISSSGDDRQKGLVRSVKRTSSLEAPIISLSGSHSVSGTMHTRVSLGGSYMTYQGRDTQLSIRSYRTKHCSLFSRQKRLCVPSFLPSCFPSSTHFGARFFVEQRSGGPILQTPTTPSCPASTKPPSSTSTGLSARPRSTLSLQTTSSASRTSPLVNASKRSARTVGLSIPSTGRWRAGRGWNSS